MNLFDYIGFAEQSNLQKFAGYLNLEIFTKIMKIKENLNILLKELDRKLFLNLLRKFYNFYRIIKVKQLLTNINKNNYFINTSYINYNNNFLTKLCEKYKTDKGSINYNKKSNWGKRSHSYSNYYYSIFNHFKDDVKLLFEFGLGIVDGKSGASLKVWKEYFKKAQIYGGDINKDILFNEDRIKTYYLDQLDTRSIKKMWKKIKVKNFDIIIDDGLHTKEAIINCFVNSFEKLKNNGVYIIEDVKPLEINDIMIKLKDYSPELVTLRGNNIPQFSDNNLIIVRKI